MAKGITDCEFDIMGRVMKGWVLVAAGPGPVVFGVTSNGTARSKRDQSFP
jgi:hypothetical protein